MKALRSVPALLLLLAVMALPARGEGPVMRRAVPLALFKTALKTPGLKIVFGADAVAGAHGHNFEELIYR